MLTQFRMNAVCLRRATSPIYCCTSIIGINSYILCTSSIQNTGPSHSVEVWHVGAYVVFYNSLKYVALLYVPGSINTIRHRHTYGTYSYSRTYFMFVRKVLRSISGIVVMPVIPWRSLMDQRRLGGPRHVEYCILHTNYWFKRVTPNFVSYE